MGCYRGWMHISLFICVWKEVYLVSVESGWYFRHQLQNRVRFRRWRRTFQSSLRRQCSCSLRLLTEGMSRWSRTRWSGALIICKKRKLRGGDSKGTTCWSGSLKGWECFRIDNGFYNEMLAESKLLEYVGDEVWKLRNFGEVMAAVTVGGCKLLHSGGAFH